jgi:Arc/MetJ family transcription regulator
LVDQLGTALESARLYQDTQRRATREQLTRQMTEEMQRATDIDNLVQNAMQQLRAALSASRLVVHLGTEDELRTRLDGQNPGTPSSHTREET